MTSPGDGKETDSCLAVFVSCLAWRLRARVPLRSGRRSRRCAQDMHVSDIQRLEQTVDQINARLVTLRQRDRAAARTLQAELAELDEEVTYLKVKLRKERNVPRADYIDVRDRLENLRAARAAVTTTHRRLRGSGRGRAAARPARTRVDQRGPRIDATGVVPVGHRARRSAGDGAELRHRAGRGSLRGDDRRRPSAGRPRADSGRLARARRCDRRAGRPAASSARAACRSSFDQITDQRPHLSDARHRHAGARKRRLSGRRREDRHAARRSAASSAASSAA